MNEQKLNPMLSYDTEKNKPKLLNDEAVYLCIEFIKNPEKKLDENCHFNVDNLFQGYMWDEGVASKTYPPAYSQEEIDKFVLKMIQECSEVEEDELPPLLQTMPETQDTFEMLKKRDDKARKDLNQN